MSDPSLSSPVGLRARPVPPLAAGDSLRRALTLLDGELLPVIVRGDRFVGAVTGPSLARAIADGAGLDDSAEAALVKPRILAPHATGAEALRMMTTDGVGTVAIVDADGVYRGVVGAGDLLVAPEPPRPNVVGGMATPLGVYFTTGSLSAGVSRWGLALTGALLTTILLAASNLGFWLGERVPPSFGNLVAGSVPILIFALAMRLMPLSGVHGAEHQVVHAIERGERLVPEVVRRMPRIHPRCGTNFAAGMSLFLLLFTWRWTGDDELRLLVAALVTLFFWRPLGSVLQQWVTTKRPSDRQLAGAIRGGEELLRRHALAERRPSGPLVRIWQSGMLVVMAGSFAVAGLGYLLQSLTGWDLGIR